MEVLQSARSCIKRLFRISAIVAILAQINILLGKLRHHVSLILICELHEIVG